jgi:hypothetical protein
MLEIWGDISSNWVDNLANWAYICITCQVFYVEIKFSTTTKKFSGWIGVYSTLNLALSTKFGSFSTFPQLFLQSLARFLQFRTFFYKTRLVFYNSAPSSTNPNSFSTFPQLFLQTQTRFLQFFSFF